jgi:hypothetical protein
VSKKGLDEAEIREYLKNQEKLEQEKQMQLNLPDFE